MPEFPEVAVSIQAISNQILGRSIESAHVSTHLDGQWWDLNYLTSGFSVYKISQRGKYIEIHLLRSEELRRVLDIKSEERLNYKIPPKLRCILIIHLGMSGMITTIPATSDNQPHRHINIRLGVSVTESSEDEFVDLQVYDPRKFGRIALCKRPADQKIYYKNTGPDLYMISGVRRARYLPPVMDKSRGSKIFINRYRDIYPSGWSLKKCLLDQRAISGIGNIYASEILFASGLLPTRELGSIPDRWLRTIYEEGIRIISDATRLGGSSIQSFKDPNGIRGQYQDYHSVYNRGTCDYCGSSIVSLKLDGRSTFWCPSCQR